MTCAQGLLRLLWGGPKLECYGTDCNQVPVMMRLAATLIVQLSNLCPRERDFAVISFACKPKARVWNELLEVKSFRANDSIKLRSFFLRFQSIRVFPKLDCQFYSMFPMIFFLIIVEQAWDIATVNFYYKRYTKKGMLSFSASFKHTTSRQAREFKFATYW